MKVLNAEQLRRADRFTMEHEPIGSLDLMERAGRRCAERIRAAYGPEHPTIFLCGTGNNGGDGLVIARYLHDYFSDCKVFIVRYSDKETENFAINLKRLTDTISIDIQDIRTENDFPTFTPETLVTDAVFGAGLNRPVRGFTARLFDQINDSGAIVAAIDIPSGMYAEKNAENERAVLRADRTFTIGAPKLSLLYDDNYPRIGDWELIDINIPSFFLENIKTDNYMLTPDLARRILRKRKKTDHKGVYGHALLCVGSYGKMGAAVLSSKACLRSGAGLLTVHSPRCGYEIMQQTVPEAMVSADNAERLLSDFGLPEAYHAIGIGPGIGTAPYTGSALENLLENCNRPLILDADALNLIAAKSSRLQKIPADSILTPHPKEFARLTGRNLHGTARHRLQSEMSKEYGIYIILKGAHSCVTFPDGRSFFNTAGNPGMATAGSGDVLTGILTALGAQGYSADETCLLGMFLQGVAGDIAADRTAQEALTAGDIIKNLGRAFKAIKTDLQSRYFPRFED